jgi:hypothetical protein
LSDPLGPLGQICSRQCINASPLLAMTLRGVEPAGVKPLSERLPGYRRGPRRQCRATVFPKAPSSLPLLLGVSRREFLSGFAGQRRQPANQRCDRRGQWDVCRHIYSYYGCGAMVSSSSTLIIFPLWRRLLYRREGKF